MVTKFNIYDSHQQQWVFIAVISLTKIIKKLSYFKGCALFNQGLAYENKFYQPKFQNVVFFKTLYIIIIYQLRNKFCHFLCQRAVGYGASWQSVHRKNSSTNNLNAAMDSVLMELLCPEADFKTLEPSVPSWLTLVSVMSGCLFGNKPLPEPMLTLY